VRTLPHQDVGRMPAATGMFNNISAHCNSEATPPHRSGGTAGRPRRHRRRAAQVLLSTRVDRPRRRRIGPARPGGAPSGSAPSVAGMAHPTGHKCPGCFPGAESPRARNLPLPASPLPLLSPVPTRWGDGAMGRRTARPIPPSPHRPIVERPSATPPPGSLRSITGGNLASIAVAAIMLVWNVRPSRSPGSC
jgi:hypothetical protein